MSILGATKRQSSIHVTTLNQKTPSESSKSRGNTRLNVMRPRRRRSIKSPLYVSSSLPPQVVAW